MKILANRHLYHFEKFLPENVTVDFFDPNEFPEQAINYDAMFINTTTPINPNTLPKSGKLQFIATGSSGDDHVDKDHLKKLEITFQNAAGCNAQSVAEYVMTSLLVWADKTGRSLQNSRVGIVGYGHVGEALSDILETFSIPFIKYDPPRTHRDSDFNSAHFDELKHCNILSFHTPLTTTGNYPTYHLLNSSWFSGKDFDLVINTARGGVTDEKALMKEMNADRLGNVVTDVWENEPEFSPLFAEKSFFATPHIAGYSIQAKQKASRMITDAFCTCFNLTPKKQDTPVQKFIDLKDEFNTISDLLLRIHPIQTYDNALRKISGKSPRERRRIFSTLRSTMPLRNEYRFLEIPQRYLDRFPDLKKLGVNGK